MNDSKFLFLENLSKCLKNSIKNVFQTLFFHVSFSNTRKIYFNWIVDDLIISDPSPSTVIFSAVSSNDKKTRRLARVCVYYRMFQHTSQGWKTNFKILSEKLLRASKNNLNALEKVTCTLWTKKSAFFRTKMRILHRNLEKWKQYNLKMTDTQKPYTYTYTQYTNNRQQKKTKPTFF